jgi:SAM-dependent methyltransferase
MSSNAVQTNIDVAQLTQNIREQINRKSNSASVHKAEEGGEHPVSEQLLENVRSIDRELDSLGSQLEDGEPSLASRTMRGRIGSAIKRRLYRLLWWQTHQIQALTALTIRRGREETNAINVLAERAGRQNAEISRVNQSVSECKRQLQDSENRLRQLESAQLRLQAAEIERNVKGAAQLETALASLRQELNEVLAQRIETVAAQQQETIARHSELVQRETAPQQEILARLSELVQQETAQREQLSARLSELGLFTHQTRTTLSLQDRRLTVFIEEARKRLREPFTDDQLREIVNQHNDHRYDSVYAAFEDVFRGSREEIKARQSIYLPLLNDSGIGSAETPVLDLGSGRGEWLELLRENGLQARGVDRNERMIEYCKAVDLQVVQSDVLPYLRALPDASLGAVTSFHMVEHIPFEATLELVDEALRLLKSGGVLILETPNPQNILVGSHSFHFDPSHLKPLPSPMLRFFVEARGFCDVHVRDLHPYPEAVRFPDDGKGMASRLNDYLYGPQDYAVIGRKP